MQQNPLGNITRRVISKPKGDIDDPLYPHVKVKLVGENGNAYAIMARTRRALKAAGLPQWRLDEYMKQALAAPSYNELLQTTMKWVDCDEFLDDEFAQMVTRQAGGRVRDDFYVDELG